MPLKDSKLHWSPEHCNSNVLCAIDIRVGGTDPSCSDLLEVAFVPLNHSFKMHTQLNLFSLKMRPSWPVDNRVAHLNAETLEEYKKSSVDGQGGYALFEHWCQTTLELKTNKKIMPVCYDWSYMKPFLKAWMGEEGFEYHVSESIRDVQCMMNFVNDRHSFWGDDVPYPIIKRSQLFRRNGVGLVERNSLLAVCKGVIDIYGLTLRKFLPGHTPNPLRS